jgi:murein DD-endopeptidase MepM/ murein hydrolase activator NlpD
MALRGVLAGAVVAMLAALLGVAAAAADTTTTDTTTTTVASTTTEPTTTEPVTTTTAAAPTTTAPTTTAMPPTTTRAAPSATTTRTTTTRARRAGPKAAVHPRVKAKRAHVRRRAVKRHRRVAPCRVQTAVLLVPGRRPRVLGAHGPHASVARVRCVRAATRLRSVSLLGGSVTAGRVTLAARRRPAAAATGLVVRGRRLGATRRAAVRPWGWVVAARRVPVHVPGGRNAFAGLVVHLVKRHAGLPAGATLAVAVAGLQLDRLVPRPHRRPRHGPLRVTPPLGGRHHIFPVAGGADYGDTYGGFRGDVPGNWHHGDDLFAPLGTPVVALASGTVFSVGWETLGGWRLWLRDRAGNEYYYAHLSGYALSRLRRQQVRAGQVLGFVGNTGDAFTTPPHLHFEIHPRRLLRRGYDGAVDPTTYLRAWTPLQHVRAGRPVHPPLPDEPATRREARTVFRRLLAARGLLPHPASARPRAPQHSDRPRAVARPAVRRPAAAERSTLALPLASGVASIAMFAALLAVPPFRRRALAALRNR